MGKVRQHGSEQQTDREGHQRRQDAEPLEETSGQSHLHRERDGAADGIEPAEVGAERALVLQERLLGGCLELVVNEVHHDRAHDADGRDGDQVPRAQNPDAGSGPVSALRSRADRGRGASSSTEALRDVPGQDSTDGEVQRAEDQQLFGAPALRYARRQKTVDDIRRLPAGADEGEKPLRLARREDVLCEGPKLNDDERPHCLHGHVERRRHGLCVVKGEREEHRHDNRPAEGDERVQPVASNPVGDARVHPRQDRDGDRVDDVHLWQRVFGALCEEQGVADSAADDDGADRIRGVQRHESDLGAFSNAHLERSVEEPIDDSCHLVSLEQNAGRPLG
jgi:hypothetical protein